MTERTKEESVKDRIKRKLNAMRVYYTMPPANGYGKTGNFDFICCVDGAFLGIEAKRDDKEQPTQLQSDNALAARMAGGVTLLIHKDNLELVVETVHTLRLRMACRHVAYGLGYWPPPVAQPNDDDVVVVRRKA